MTRWTAAQANAWYDSLPWLLGCNFIPSNAINQLEMWQADTFDPDAIDRELSWAAGLGMNTVRTYLHNLAWSIDRDGFLARVDQFLAIAAAHGIRPALVIFDDCWNADPQPGPQPAPKPGVHNSGWVQSPGIDIVNDPSRWTGLDDYVQDVVGRFAEDKRVLFWDLYNEPGNNKQGPQSLPLVKAVFDWARAASPSQPLTVGLWFKQDDLNAFQLEASDVVSFHNYMDAAHLEAEIRDLSQYGRPLICTEWLRRGHSEVVDCLPVLHREKVGAYNWGLVSGKTQTIYAWDTPLGDGEPEVWFHDLLRADGTPYRKEEVAVYRRLSGVDAG